MTKRWKRSCQLPTRGHNRRSSRDDARARDVRVATRTRLRIVRVRHHAAIASRTSSRRDRTHFRVARDDLRPGCVSLWSSPWRGNGLAPVMSRGGQWTYFEDLSLAPPSAGGSREGDTRRRSRARARGGTKVEIDVVNLRKSCRRFTIMGFKTTARSRVSRGKAQEAGHWI